MFEIGARPKGGYVVRSEECRVQGPELDAPPAYFRVEQGEVTDKSVDVAPAALPDRLYLVNASGLPEFRPVYDELSRMGFYNLNPGRIRELRPPDPGELLYPDGRNLASVLRRLWASHSDVREQVEAYLERIVPGIKGVKPVTVASMDTLEFRLAVAGQKDPWRFGAQNMSDGTLRVLAILTALFQFVNADGHPNRVPLVGIEEPEIALHPAAAGLLLNALRIASYSTQVLVTSHSPDMLDSKEIDPEEVLGVVAENGITRIGRRSAPSASSR